jgi:hypothetical protein
LRRNRAANIAPFDPQDGNQRTRNGEARPV